MKNFFILVVLLFSFSGNVFAGVQPNLSKKGFKLEQKNDKSEEFEEILKETKKPKNLALLGLASTTIIAAKLLGGWNYGALSILKSTNEKVMASALYGISLGCSLSLALNDAFGIHDYFYL